MRADARRNRRRLLDAACRVVVELGADASLEVIARRAGVGIATLYRHFPDRRSLMLAVAADVMTRIAVEARTALDEEPDAFSALRRYMHRALDLQVAAVMPVLSDIVAGDPEVGALLDRAARAQRMLIDRARNEGSLRAEVAFGDIGLALNRLSRPIGGGFDPDLDASLAHRHLEIYLDGLRPHGGPPLPGPALTLRKLRAMQRRSHDADRG